MSHSRRERWTARLALLAWIAFLGYWAFGRAAAIPETGLAPSQHDTRGGGALALARDLGAGWALEVAQFALLGMLLVLSMPRREGRFQRFIQVAIPAFFAALLVAAAVMGMESGQRWRWPGAGALVLPFLGALLGVWMGLAWLRGLAPRLWLLPKLAILAAMLAVGLGALLYFASEPAAMSFEPPPVTSAEKRRLHALFKSRNPAKIPQGQTQTLRVTSRDVDLLLAWGLPLSRTGAKAKVELEQDEATLLFSAGIPVGKTARYWNVTARGPVAFDDSGLRIGANLFRMGQLEAPRWLVGLAEGPLLRSVLRDRRVKPVATAVRDLKVEDGAASVTYGPATLPRGFLADLFGGEGTSRDLIPAVQAQVRHLVDTAHTLPSGEARFGAMVERAFTLARERSATSSAVRENQAAVVALGILLGSSKVERLVGEVTDDDLRGRLRGVFKRTTLRRRADWTKHFFVSAALTVLSGDAVSDAAGLLKEELDADGGSGFSFGDLLADRAGTRFAQAATQDEGAARTMQGRLARSFRVDDVFPDAAGLPEDIQDRELQARYGGVGGKEYLRIVADIEKRLSGCVAYRGLGGP